MFIYGVNRLVEGEPPADVDKNRLGEGRMGRGG